MRKLSVLMLALVLALSFALSASADVNAADFPPGPKLGDERVRQALMYALDRENFILAEYGSEELARVGLAPISPVSWAFPDESELNAYPYDIDKANALLDEAGWVMGDDGYRYKDDVKLALSWLVYTDVPWPSTLSSMAFDSWKQIGVELTVELMDFNTVSARAQEPEPGEKDFDIYTMGFSLDADPDPSNGLYAWSQFMAGGFNSSGYFNARSEELINLGKSSFDQAERAEYYKEWAVLMNEMIPTAIVAYRSEIWGVNDRVKNMDQNAYVKWDDIIGQIELEGDQILRFGETSFDGKFNPIMSDKVYDSYIVDILFEKLIDNDATGSYVAGPLADYELGNENRTYTFTLKDGVAFSDGTPMTADDVYFTYMMIAHPDYNGPRLSVVMGLEGYDEYAAGDADTISGIEVIDDKTVAFTFKEASPANIKEMQYPIMPRAYYEADTFDAFLLNIDKPLGSGKFVLDEYQAGQMLSLSRNENYWDPDNAAKIEGIYITMVPEESKVPALQLNQIDLAQVTANVDNVNAIDAMDGVSLQSFLGNGYTYMQFNTLH